MLNANKISEIKIIIEGLLKDVESLNELQMVSHIKWEEVMLNVSMVTQKLTTLRVEQERNYLRELKEQAQKAVTSRDEEIRLLTQSIAELKRSLSDVNLNLSKSIVPNLFTSKEVTSVTLKAEEQEVVQEPLYTRESFVEQADVNPVVDESSEEIEFEFLSDTRPIIDAAMGTTPEWMKDNPGPRVNNLHMAITLNDKLFFVKELFMGDEDQFRLSIQRLNEMSSLDEALEYTRSAFTEWDEQSAAVYRFYMILRRRYDG
ncbi:MAG: hypothetical protein CVU10_11095 [Bacteroidetes bacterium HGW-Bacteroidetes-5]|jgi:hypothetical protein|nr:MAG: hypothetical protein CVU10_11095 [Bacteroidetes bacterium HGW-Bacteroidetes-5]